MTLIKIDAKNLIPNENNLIYMFNFLYEHFIFIYACCIISEVVPEIFTVLIYVMNIINFEII